MSAPREYSIKEIAAEYAVSVESVRRWQKSGLLETDKGYRRVGHGAYVKLDPPEEYRPDYGDPGNGGDPASGYHGEADQGGEEFNNLPMAQRLNMRLGLLRAQKLEQEIIAKRLQGGVEAGEVVLTLVAGIIREITDIAWPTLTEEGRTKWRALTEKLSSQAVCDALEEELLTRFVRL